MPRLGPNPDTLRDLIENQKLTQQQAAENLGYSVSCIERTCKRLALKTQRTGPRAGPGHPDWKGGRYYMGQYLYVWSPDHPNRTKAGYVAEHRLVQEAKLGRYLLKQEVVHHINGDPRDNRPENLQHFATNPEHLRYELTGKIPNHTPEGLERMAESARRTRIRDKSKRDALGRIQTTPR